MKKLFIKFILSAGIAGSLQAQEPSNLTKGSDTPVASSIFQQSNGFIHLSPSSALESGEFALSQDGRLTDWPAGQKSMTWRFNVDRPGLYNVQVITAHQGKVVPHQFMYICEGVKKNIRLKQSRPFYEVESKDTLNYSMPGGSVAFHHKGTYELKLQLKKRVGEKPIPFRKVRVVPYFSNRIGTPEHQAHWQKMHASSAKQETLKWFKNAKYGMFIHWGLYSQAGGIWKGKKIEKSPFSGPRVAEWLMSTFRISRKEYAELAKTFKPNDNFAEAIVKLAKDSGMKYIVITAKHHDGFALFDSACSEYDIIDSSPYKKDAIKELYDACQKQGIKFGVYYSHGNDWYDGADGNFAADKKRNDKLGMPTRQAGKNVWDSSPNSFNDYVENKSLAQIKELVTMMPELKLIWFDGAGGISEQQSWDFYKSIYAINPKVLVSRRIGYGFGDYVDAGDNKIPEAGTMQKHWETVGTANNSWGFKPYDKDWKSTKELLYWFIDICSKGGNYMLNIGPDGQGVCPSECADKMRGMGDWLEVNGEAIYGTTNWKVTKEGPLGTPTDGTGHREKHGFSANFTNRDFWFTAKGNKVYAISLNGVSDKAVIKSLKKTNGAVKSVRLLGYEKPLSWEQKEDALHVELKGIELGQNGYALEVTL